MKTNKFFFTQNPRTWLQLFGVVVVSLLMVNSVVYAQPAIPILATPADSAVQQPQSPTMIWNSSPGASTYRLQVSTNIGFTTTVFDDSTITGKSKLVTGLLMNTKYFWRVNAKSGLGTSNYSSINGFTTWASLPSGPLPVTLGLTGGFAILAYSEITTVPGSAITGDVGVSPASGAFLGLTQTQVTGTMYTVDATGPAGSVVAPTLLTQAMSDLTIAYNDAAGRTVNPIGLAGNLGGQTLYPGLYKSSGSLEISAGDLTLDANGNANAVWIFQIASSFNMTSGRQVFLVNGANASNIFWQVGSAATFGTTAVMKGTIMAMTQVTMATGASLDGRALANTANVTLQQNVVTMPPAQNTPPSIISTSPTYSATSVPLNQKIAVTFSKAMDISTITAATFTVKQGTTPVSGTMTSAGMNAILFTPASTLTASSVYTVKLSTGVKDLVGNALVADYIWSFTTGAAADTTKPTVTSTDPANNTTAETVKQKLTAIFSEAMDLSTITTATFTVKQGTTPVSGSITYTGSSAIFFTPAGNLASSTVYTATITTGVKDLAGNAMAANYVWSFTTSSATSVANSSVPSEFSLSQNYPNPFNPATQIEYSVKNAGAVTLTVYDLLGNEVAVLVNGRQETGSYSVVFNSEAENRIIASGIYFYRLVSRQNDGGRDGTFSAVKKLILLK